MLPASFRFFQRVDAFTVLDPGADARVFAFGRLRDGVSAAQAQDEMRVFAVQEWAPRVEDLQAYLVRGPRADLPVLMTAAALVLLIACANVAGLVLARAAGRKRELAIRTALGAGRLRLVRQLLAESLLLAGLAGALGFALAAWVATVVRAQLPPEVLPNPERLVVDGRVLAFTLALSVITSLLFGLAPALRASAEALRSGTGPGRDTARLRRTLAGAEVAAAVVLVSGTLLIGRALSSASDGGPLADPASVLTTRLALPQYRYSTPERIAAFHGGVVSRAQADPAIAAVALATSLRYRGDGSRLEFTVGSDESPRSAARSAVTGSYFGLMGIALRRGRLLADGDRGIAVINEAFARSFLHEREPVGSQLRAGGELIEIVGIVRDEHASGPAGPSPLVYVPFWEKPPAECSLLARGPNDDRAATAAALRTAINSADRDLPIAEVATIAELRDRALAVPRVLAGIMGAFGGLALLLALIGTYGLVSFTVAQRVSEMGLRIALGAGRGDIARLVLREAALLGGLGAATGAAGSIVIALALRSRLFGVPPQHPGTALAVALAVMLTTIAAAALPARRAAGVDPVVALRQE